MSAADSFIALEDALFPTPAPSAPPRAEGASEVQDLPEVQVRDEAGDVHERAVLREVRLFAARLADALDERLARLLAGIASDVLVRELRTAPADLAALVARIAAESAAPPLRIRVAPAECDRAAMCGLPVDSDPTLAPGDAVVAFADGEIDARLGVRLAALLEALR
jgi:flagellar biosynthesis/type III secretory pathway protein FliH